MTVERNRPRSRAYDHIDVWLPLYVNEHGELPTYATVQQFLRVSHELGSSSSTVQRALNRWTAVAANQALLTAARSRVRDQLKASSAGVTIEGSTTAASSPTSTADPLLASALSALRASIREEESKRIHAEADKRIEEAQATADEAVRAARAAQEKAMLLLEAAEERQRRALERVVEIEGTCERRLQDAVASNERLMTSHIAERAAIRDELEKQTQERVAAACAPLRDQITTLEHNVKELIAANTGLTGRIEVLQGELLTSERNAASQHSEITRHWANELSRSREETKETQAALRKAVAEKEGAVRAARSEAIEGIIKALNDLRESVGGVNAVHNTHLGGISTRLDALTKAVAKAAANQKQGGPTRKSLTRAPSP